MEIFSWARARPADSERLNGILPWDRRGLGHLTLRAVERLASLSIELHPENELLHRNEREERHFKDHVEKP